MTPFGQVQDYAFGLDHAGCEVVVYGDSSAMTSVDPTTIESQTHLRTCNISQTQPIVEVMGTVPIDLYLEKNQAPRYLVIQVAPETFYQPHTLDKTPAFEPITMMLRHHRGTSTTLALLRYPLQTLRYVNLALQDRYEPDRFHVAAFAKTYSDSIANYYKTRGLMTLPYPAEGGCGGAKVLAGPADFGWVEDARRRYSAMGIKVLVFTSPIPDCDSQIAIYRRELSGHLDGGVRTLPVSLFNELDRHFTKAGAVEVSTALGKMIADAESHR